MWVTRKTTVPDTPDIRQSPEYSGTSKYLLIWLSNFRDTASQAWHPIWCRSIMHRPIGGKQCIGQCSGWVVEHNFPWARFIVCNRAFAWGCDTQAQQPTLWWGHVHSRDVIEIAEPMLCQHAWHHKLCWQQVHNRPSATKRYSRSTTLHKQLWGD